jgi:DNA-binding CsgD family transcriptional regulator
MASGEACNEVVRDEDVGTAKARDNDAWFTTEPKPRWPRRLFGRPLTAIELDVLIGATRGESCLETAARRGTAHETVKTQRRKVIAKLGARNIRHAITIAIDRDLIIAKPRPELVAIARAAGEYRDQMSEVSRAIAVGDWRLAFLLLCPSVCSEHVALAFLLEQGFPG